MTTQIDSHVQDQTAKDASATVPFLDVLYGRHSVRKYDSSVSISEEEIREMIEIATRAPSSSNMQPWRFLVITDQETKQKLVPVAFNQQQVAEASAIVIVLGDLEMYKKSEEIYDASFKAGFMSEEVKNNMTANSLKMYPSLPAERLKEIVVFDTGLVAMQLMLTARAKGYDTVPMGGYNRDQVIEMFGIPPQYLPTLMLPIGKAATPGHMTPRLPVDEITFFNQM
ncbi:nitroreductase family protein [Paenibacillus sp. HB172176]|uniref:nitroreductase family protein n=1 Tax=Paenibacillus sp. HB172176 TaxID=2493690 RepID=UPI001438A2CC|nr:nitroreductase family protein [Paenibacillus sp. HB172176]